MTQDLIIPDIHEKVQTVREIIADHPNVRNRIFLGDYWDSFEYVNNPDQWFALCDLLEQLAADPRNILLGGNHDLHYMSDIGEYKCSGWIKEKQGLIRKRMGTHWYFKNLRWVYPVLIADKLTVFSHAGVNVAHLDPMAEMTPEYFQNLNDSIQERLQAGLFDPRMQAGRGRGGRGIGGVVWQDWDREYSGLPGVRQVVGHTPHVEPRWFNEDLCLDTHLGHVAFMDTETGVITTEWA